MGWDEMELDEVWEAETYASISRPPSSVSTFSCTVLSSQCHEALQWDLQ